MAVSGLYGGTARRPDRTDNVEETRRYFRGKGRAEWLLLAVPFLGAAALGLRPKGADFGDIWVVAASVIWLAAAVLLVGVIRPAEQRIREGLRTDRTPSIVEVAGAGRRLMWAAVTCDFLFVAALVLMIGQPV